MPRLYGLCWFYTGARHAAPLLVVSEIDLDFVDAFEDLFGIGFDVGADKVDIILIIGFVEEEVLFHVGEFDVDFGDADLHVDPYRDDGDKECEQAYGLSDGHSENGVFCGHIPLVNEELGMTNEE